MKPLTLREREVLHLRATGMTNRQVAEKLGVAMSTAEMFVRRALMKTGTSRVSDAAIVGLAMNPADVTMPEDKPSDAWTILGKRLLDAFEGCPWLSPVQANLMKEVEAKMTGRKRKL